MAFFLLNFSFVQDVAEEVEEAREDLDAVTKEVRKKNKKKKKKKEIDEGFFLNFLSKRSLRVHGLLLPLLRQRDGRGTDGAERLARIECARSSLKRMKRRKIAHIKEMLSSLADYK